MKLNLKKKFAEFGPILREISLFKVRGQKLPLLKIEIVNENLIYGYGLFLNLNSMRLKAKILINLLRNMFTIK